MLRNALRDSALGSAKGKAEMQIELDYRCGEGGRPEGTLRVRGESEALQFVGIMQLLRLLEEISDGKRRAAMRAHPASGHAEASQAS